MSLLGGLIGGAVSLIGGKKKRDAAATQFITSMPKTQRRLWEKAGFNPLFGIAKGNIPQQNVSTIGDDYQEAGRFFQRGLELQHQEQLKKTKLAQENEKLREKIDELAKPNIPSYLQQYGAVVPTASAVSKSQESVGGGETDEDFMRGYLDDPAGYTTMRSVSGDPVKVRNDVLYRLQLPPGALYGMAEDAEMVFGEIGGEVTGVGNIGDAMANPITERVVPLVRGPKVKPVRQRELPAIDDGAFHQNPSDFEAIMRNRYNQE